MSDRHGTGLRASLPGLIVAAFLLATASHAGTTSGPVDWTRYAGETTITVISADADGSRRETTVWLVVVAGQAYVRTGSTHWGDNVASRPDVLVRIGAEEIPVRAQRVSDARVERIVQEAFRTKYGWEDRLLASVFRAVPRIFHLVPRASGGAALGARADALRRRPAPRKAP